MHLVTSPTGAAALRLIDMDIVQIPIPVTESRQRGGFRRGEHACFVAIKAERVKSGVVSRVKLRRIVQGEEAEMFAAMRIMASAAVLGLDWTVVIGIVRQQCLEIGERLALRILDPILAVAVDAEIEGQADQQMFHIGGVRIVTIEAFPIGVDRPMLHFGLRDQGLDILMATHAQRPNLLREQLRQLGIMRVVTIDATSLGRSMTELAGHDPGEFLVTTQAELINGCFDRAGILGIIVLVADTAVGAFKGAVGSHRFCVRRQGRQADLFQLGHRERLALLPLRGASQPAAPAQGYSNQGQYG